MVLEQTNMFMQQQDYTLAGNHQRASAAADRNKVRPFFFRWYLSAYLIHNIFKLFFFTTRTTYHFYVEMCAGADVCIITFELT